MSNKYYTKWHKEMDIFYKVKPIMIMEGNILDQFQYPTNQSVIDLTHYIDLFLQDKGYETIVSFNDIEGFYSPNNDTSSLERFSKLSGCHSPLRDNRIQVPFAGRDETAPILVQKLLSQSESPSAVIMNLASRYITSPDNLSKEEVNSFTNLLLAGTNAAEVQPEGSNVFCKNLLFFIVNKTNDIPVWFYLNNPLVKTLYITTPTKEERSILVKGDRFRTFFNSKIYKEDITNYQLSEEEKATLSPEIAKEKQDKLDQDLEKIQDKFIGITEGFTFLELNDLRKLCKNEKSRIASMSEVVDLYRYGIRENPWTRKDLQDSLRNAKDVFTKRVKGQDSAITKTLDVVKRAATGMSGLQHSSHTKPKGILFYAGPTGTGKTETAKTLAELLFGEESRCIRFDMSEYSQPQSDQKLLGAPPGYVGYEAGGQLTNAVRENPFSILLFDEIEKAHGSIFDKFLQILEDGRMTDGQGKTVYFSECIIIFTSNLGIYRSDESGKKVLNVTPSESYEQVEQKVKEAIGDYFKLELGRPEILNRIGENIVVFDFIRETTAELILNAQIDKIISLLKTEKNISLTLSDNAINVLKLKAFENLSNGGRGIGNVVENVLINPISRYMFDTGILMDGVIHIQDINTIGSTIQLVV